MSRPPSGALGPRSPRPLSRRASPARDGRDRAGALPATPRRSGRLGHRPVLRRSPLASRPAEPGRASSDARPPRCRRRRPRPRGRAGPPLVGIAAFVVVVVGIYLASGIVSMILLSVLVAILVAPIATWVRRRGWPGWAALVLALASYVVVLVIVGLITAIGIFRLLEELPTDTTEPDQTARRRPRRLRRWRRPSPTAFGTRAHDDRPGRAGRAGGGRLQRDHRRVPAARGADRPGPPAAGRSASNPSSRTGGRARDPPARPT